jgi:PHP family Zn ribbon phosphoesterase
MRRILADLHIHTALSPCASSEMTPPAIVERAIGIGLEMIAICDHNTAGNTAATEEAAGEDIAVIAGVEITTSEEVHVLGLFPNVEAACALSAELLSTLPEADSSSERMQVLMNSRGEILGTETRMLAASTSYDLSESIDIIKRYRGLAIAAHLNRPSFSVLSQLGFFPKDAGFDAVEILSGVRSSSSMRENGIPHLPVLTSSDSHFLSDIGTYFNVFEINEPSFSELVLAIEGISGRRRCPA